MTDPNLRELVIKVQEARAWWHRMQAMYRDYAHSPNADCDDRDEAIKRQQYAAECHEDIARAMGH